MAIEQQTPEISRDPFEVIGPFTENELCKPVAVKLILKELADVKETKHSVLGQLQTERSRNDTLTGRANIAETELRVLNATLYVRHKRDLIVRLVELVIIVLVEFAIEAAKSTSWTSFAVLCVASLVLVAVIALIHLPLATPEKR